MLCRLQQDRLVMRQGAKDKLQQLVAPLLCLHDPQALAFKAFGNIRPRISLRFEECGLLLSDGRSVLSGVTGYFGHSKVATCACRAVLCSCQDSGLSLAASSCTLTSLRTLLHPLKFAKAGCKSQCIHAFAFASLALDMA